MIKSIVVGIDFSPISGAAFDKALEMARLLGAPLELVHVSSPVPIEARDGGGTTTYVREAEAQLQELVARAAAVGVTARAQVIDETVVFGLLQAIAELEPQLVVVGSHGGSAIGSALLGSVSESLARRSSAPVLIVPAAERAARAQAAAWACARCGHILGRHEDHRRCKRCGAAPAAWTTSPVGGAPAEEPEERTVGEPVAADLQPTQTQSTSGLFATSPAGSYGDDINPELRVRY